MKPASTSFTCSQHVDKANELSNMQLDRIDITKWAKSAAGGALAGSDLVRRTLLSPFTFLTQKVRSSFDSSSARNQFFGGCAHGREQAVRTISSLPDAVVRDSSEVTVPHTTCTNLPRCVTAAEQPRTWSHLLHSLHHSTVHCFCTPSVMSTWKDARTRHLSVGTT